MAKLSKTDPEIILSQSLLRNEFSKLNALYFGHALKEIPIEIEPTKHYVAYLVQAGLKTRNADGICWQFSEPKKIVFSSLHIFTAKSLKETLCHEMIHQLMAQRKEREYGRSSHGENFAAYCYEIETKSKLQIPRK